jgi:hypothetical protein
MKTTATNTTSNPHIIGVSIAPQSDDSHNIINHIQYIHDDPSIHKITTLGLSYAPPFSYLGFVYFCHEISIYLADLLASNYGASS